MLRYRFQVRRARSAFCALRSEPGSIFAAAAFALATSSKADAASLVIVRAAAWSRGTESFSRKTFVMYHLLSKAGPTLMFPSCRAAKSSSR